MPARHSLGRVAYVSLEGNVCKQAGFPVSFGSLCFNRVGKIALPSSFTSMNSVASWWKLLFLELTLWTLMNLQRLWSLGEGIVVVLSCPMTRDVRKPGTSLLPIKIGIICCATNYWPRRRKRFL